MDYLSIFKSLDEKRVRYLVCGGLAVNIYGIPRMTADIDLIIDFEENNIRNFEEVLHTLHYNKAIPLLLKDLADKAKRLDLIREKNLVAFSYFNTEANLMNIDVLVEVPLDFEGLWERKSERKLGDQKMYIVSVEDLISLKEYAGRAQDKNDIILLSKIKS